VVSAQLHGDARAHAIHTHYGDYQTRNGATFFVLSNGVAAAEGDPGYVDPQPGTQFMTDHPNPFLMNNANSTCMTSFPDENPVHDYAELTLHIKVPTNANAFSFNLNFMTSEYPEFVGTQYNDKLLVLLTSAAVNGGLEANISFDAKGNPITVNGGFFDVCQSSGVCYSVFNLMGTEHFCSIPVTQLAGTGYERDDGTGQPIGGGTGWLTTQSPVKPGEMITLRFIIFDEGDYELDSAAIVDNFQWLVDAPQGGPVTIQ
jgi:hypothetical protein